MKTLNDYQHLFENDLNDVLNSSIDNLEYIEQSHFGDFLIEETTEGNERFKLWKTHEENEQYNGKIQIEYFGKLNKYTWETILKQF